MSKQVTLTVIWWIWGAVLFLILVVLSLQPALFGDDTTKVWQWFLPNLMPTMTMVGASAYAARHRSAKSLQAAEEPPSGVPFALAVGASVLYLLLLTLSVASTLFVAHPLNALQQSSLWLGPIQGLAASGIALYFVK